MAPTSGKVVSRSVSGISAKPNGKPRTSAANGAVATKIADAKLSKATAKDAVKRGTKRATQTEDELMPDEAKDVVMPLPNGTDGVKSEVMDAPVRAIKRSRRAFTPAGPLNSVPQAVQSVHADDIGQAIAVQVTAGVSSSSGQGAVLPRKLFVWGSGDSGQFGVGPPEDDKPNKLNKGKPFGNKDISMQIDDGDMGEGGIEIVVGGGMHSVMIDSKGRILTSGAEDYGTLGRKHRGSADDAEETYFNFAPVEGISPTGQGIDPTTGKEGAVPKFRAVRVASADAAGVALDDHGRLRSWGYFKDGEGRVCFADSDSPGLNKEQWHPIALPGIEHEAFSAVAAGENHILALSLQGKVYSWGTNTCYQLGRAANPRKVSQKFANSEPPRDCDLTPTTVTGLADCKRVFAGLSNGFAVEKSGKVVAWGLNTKGQTGTGLKASKVANPHGIPALGPSRHNGAEVVQIVGGNFHTAFLLSNGHVYICGDSDEGKLGLAADHPALKGSSASNPVVVREPVHVEFPQPPSWAPSGAKTEDGKTKIVSLSAGMRFTLALSADGTLYSWGTTSDDAMGQPADEVGGDQSKDTPTAIGMPGQPGAWRIMAASTAGQHSLALAVKPPQED